MPVRPRISAVVFDMDGTLFDSSEIVPDAYVSAVAGLSGRTVSRGEVIAAYPVGPPAVLLGHLVGRAVTPTEVGTYHRALRAASGALRPYEGIEAAVLELGREVRLALFTGADREACEILLRACGLRSAFAAMVGSDEVSRPKPDPEGVHEACRRLGVAPQEAAYVGDSARDLEAARRSGALAVAATWGHEYRPDHPADVHARAPRDLLSLVGCDVE